MTLLSLVELLFWLFVAWVAYSYVGYAVLVAIVSRVSPRNVLKRDIRPTVTVVTAARNEAASIAATLSNKLEQQYPSELLDVVVISDESSDATDSIVSTFDAARVRLIRQAPRAGKTAALNRAVPQARGEIVVFSDANSLYEPNAIAALVRNFADPDVGYVTGHLMYCSHDPSVAGKGSSAYMRYENWLRQKETAVGSIVGADGGIDAIRRDLYVPMSVEQQPDFVLPLSVISRGKRVVYEADAVVREDALESSGDEYRMRVRVTLRALWALYTNRSLLNPLRYGLFAIQLWSHKLLRYLVFVPLFGIVVCTALLFDVHWVYLVAATSQLALYSAGVASLKYRRLAKWRLFALAGYFVAINVACLEATWRFMRGENQATWTPRAG